MSICFKNRRDETTLECLRLLHCLGYQWQSGRSLLDEDRQMDFLRRSDDYIESSGMGLWVSDRSTKAKEPKEMLITLNLVLLEKHRKNIQ